MSHLVEAKTEMRHENHILNALKKIGVNMSMVNTYSTPQRMNNYYGKMSDRKANIIVRKGAMRGAHADVGFVKMEDGTYRMHKDSLDSWGKNLTQAYSHSVVEEELTNQGFSLNNIENKATGELVLNFTRWK